MIKVLSCFSGIGAFEKALKKLHIPYELVGFSEIDKYAVKSYCAIHGVEESLNLGDITKVDAEKLPKDLDAIFYGFPCQDISVAGIKKGFFNEDGSQTRSGLFFEALRIIEATQPKIAIAENVKNLVGKKFNAHFQVVLASLEAAGYNNYWAVLNAKGFGVPQNRERVFIVSIRKDIDTGIFKFPEPYPLVKRLKDVLEEEVDEKFYFTSANLKWLAEHNERHEQKGTGFKFNPKNPDTEYASCLRANGAFAPTDNAVILQIPRGKNKGGEHELSPTITSHAFEQNNFVKEPAVKQIGNLLPTKTRENPNQGRLYDTNGISPTLSAMQGGNLQPFVATACAMRGRYDENGDVQQQIEFSDREYANAITTAQKDSLIADKRIRKLTPKECFRLMGFDDESFHKAEAVNSNTQLYKQAGNSIVVDVLEELFCQMFDCRGRLRV